MSLPRAARSLEWLAVLAVFVLAGVLRLGYAGVNAFASDEARLSVLALRMAREGVVAPLGIASSASLPNLPASVYAFVPPYLVSTDPLFATQYMSVISWLAVVLLWAVVRRAWGAWTAWASALLFATMPFNVFFSRSIWAQNWLAPLTVLWLASMYWGVAGSRWRRWGVFAATATAGIAFQIHLAGVALGLAHVVALLRYMRQPKWLLPLVAGGLLALLPLLPLAWHGLCCATGVLEEYAAVLRRERDEPARWSDLVLRHGAQLALNRNWDYLASGDEALATDAQDLAAAGVVVLYGLGAIVWFRVVALLGRKQRALAELLLFAAIAPLVVFSIDRPNAPPRLHYLLSALPTLAVLGGASVAAMRWRGARALVVGLLLLVGGVWTLQINASLRLLDQQLVVNGLSMPLKATRDLAYQLPEGREVVVFTQSDDLQTRGEPATWAVLLWEKPHRIVDGWTTLLLPHTPALLLTDVEGMPAWEEAQFAGLTADEVTLQSMKNAPPTSYVLYAGDSSVPSVYLPIAPPIRFSSGLELVAWQQRVISGRLRVSTVYRVLDTAQTLDTPRQFTHLRTIRTLDGAPEHAADIPLAYGTWRSGDLLIGIADFLTFERGLSYWVDIGHYELATGQRFVREDGEGDSVRLGAFVIAP